MNLKGGDFMSLPASELEIRLQKVKLSPWKNLSCGLIYYDELNIANGWAFQGGVPSLKAEPFWFLCKAS